MPKPEINKKRKRKNKKDEDLIRKRGKSKANDEQTNPSCRPEADSSSVTNLSHEEQQQIDDIDEQLEENAARNNLTTINVKSILHHVVSDKRVLAMVKSVASESEKEESEVTPGSNPGNTDMELDFEPKMTRSKRKQTNQGDPIAVLASQSPMKELRPQQISRKKEIHFTELELPDSSSDEEYNPDEEEDGSDEDTKSCASFTSDLASPQLPSTPERQKTNDAKDNNKQSGKTVTRSSRKKLLEEPFKAPYPVAATNSAPADEIVVLEEGDLIAKRTRSQLPLEDIPLEKIEATFQPPDFTADMYDTIQEDDLDFEDIEWQKWLQGLINSDEVCGEEDHEDSEYNFMAEDQKEEKEEYRNDRAVRIPQKEVNELFEELLKDYDNFEDARCLDEEGEDISYLELLNIRTSVEENVKLLNTQQLERLTEQLQQHLQLLTQINLMAREDESLHKEAELTREYVNELKSFQDRASNAQLIRGLGDGVVHTSAFTFSGLEEAVEIVNSAYVPKRRNPSPRKCNVPEKDGKATAKTVRRTKLLTDDLLPPPSETNIQMMATFKSVFRFVELLPHHKLLPRTGDTPKQLNGLRVKFSDAEDNLLALGMKQHGKKWELIQEHLLPIKSPKQLQIRCKNLLSARAPENIVKYYRRNKVLWEFPTKIRVSPEPSSRRPRGRESVEPEWLINYKKKQKERRENQERIEALAIQQSLEGAAYGRPIAPKLTGGTCALALPTVSSAGEQRKVTWVAVPKSVRPWNVVTPMKSLEDVSKGGIVLPETNVTSARTSPDVSICHESVCKTSENHAPSPAVTEEAEATDDVMKTTSPMNEETIEQAQGTAGQESSVPYAESDPKSVGTTTNVTETNESNKEDGLKDSTEKAITETSTNKSATTSKNKTWRDKNGGGMTGSRVTSKSQISDNGGNSVGTSRKPTSNSQASLAGNYILEPDPKVINRAHAFAESFLAKVKKQLADDSKTYEEFLRTLATSSAEQCSPVELYRRIGVVLAQYPSLVGDFVGFLEPHQAVEAGVFMANLEFLRARTFLRKLEVHFQRSPSQFRKIINAFDSWNKRSAKDPLELQQIIIPMLKGQLHLIEEFYSFFDDLKPPVCSDDDFEEIEFGSGSEPEVDDFEEVVIPCFVEPKKIKGRPAKGDTQPKNSNTKKARKPCATAKGTKQQGTVNKQMGNKNKVSQAKTSNTGGKELSKAEGKHDNLTGKVLGDDVAKNVKASFEVSENIDSAEDGSGVYEKRAKVNTLEAPLSVTTSLQSETSNDSYRGEEGSSNHPDSLNLEHEVQGERRTSDSEEQEDDGNSDIEHDGYEEDDDDDFIYGDEIDGDVIKSDVDAEVSGCDSDAANVLSGSAVVPAKNLQRSQDGQVVLLWTRENDRLILQTCQKMGAKPETFEHIAKELEKKSADEVKKRFMDLLNLYKASNGEGTRESTNDDSCSEEEEDEDSETVGESEGEQPCD